LKAKPGRRPTQENRRSTEIRKRYYTARWARLRQLVLRRDNGLCRNCLAMDKVNIGNQVDHIQPAEDNPELFWNPENLQVLCRKCHAIKTRRGE